MRENTCSYLIIDKDSVKLLQPEEKTTLTPKEARDLLRKLAGFAGAAAREIDAGYFMQPFKGFINHIFIDTLAGKDVLQNAINIAGHDAEATFVFGESGIAHIATDRPQAKVVSALVIAFAFLMRFLDGDIDSAFFAAELCRIIDDNFKASSER